MMNFIRNAWREPRWPSMEGLYSLPEPFLSVVLESRPASHLGRLATPDFVCMAHATSTRTNSTHTCTKHGIDTSVWIRRRKPPFQATSNPGSLTPASGESSLRLFLFLGNPRHFDHKIGCAGQKLVARTQA
jgi:hypothetical protein